MVKSRIEAWYSEIDNHGLQKVQVLDRKNPKYGPKPLLGPFPEETTKARKLQLIPMDDIDDSLDEDTEDPIDIESEDFARMKSAKYDNSVTPSTGKVESSFITFTEIKYKLLDFLRIIQTQKTDPELESGDTLLGHSTIPKELEDVIDVSGYHLTEQSKTFYMFKVSSAVIEKKVFKILEIMKEIEREARNPSSTGKMGACSEKSDRLARFDHEFGGDTVLRNKKGKICWIFPEEYSISQITQITPAEDPLLRGNLKVTKFAVVAATTQRDEKYRKRSDGKIKKKYK